MENPAELVTVTVTLVRTEGLLGQQTVSVNVKV